MTHRHINPSVVVFLLISLMAASTGSAGIPVIEREVLIAFYNSTNGESWPWTCFPSSWRNADDTDFGEPGTECGWFGIACNSAEDSVVGIWMQGNYITGIIPPEIGRLTNLRVLSLENNIIRGPLPSEIGELSNLEELLLQGNMFSGALPPEIGNLTSLQRIWLHGNRLSGPVPAQITRLTQLLDYDGLVLHFNGLYSNDPAVNDFIVQKGMTDWAASQTVAPPAIEISWIGDNSVGLSWDVSDSTPDPGGYEVFFAPSGTSAWISSGWTTSKVETNRPVVGLEPATTYDFAVRTFTDPGTHNKNLVLSDLGTPVTGSTSDDGTEAAAIVIGKGDPVTLSVSGEWSAYLWSTGETTPSITVSPDSGRWFWVQVTSAAGFTESASVLVAGGDGSHPTAFFSYELNGRQLSLVDRSTEGSILWRWVFGDGATSSEQNPTLTFQADGVYTVDLHVGNGHHWDDYSANIVVGETGGGSSCQPIWVSAAGSGEGLNDTRWATDLGINNLGSDPLNYRFQLLPRGEDNSACEMSDPFTLGGNQSVVYRDVWQEFGGGVGFGSINVCVETGGLGGVTSRIYNTSDEGTFGQTLVGVVDESQDLVGPVETARLGFLFQNEQYRTNIGFMNATDMPVTIEVEFFSSDGTSLGSDAIDLAPLSNNQWTEAFTRVTDSDVVGGFVVVWSDTPGASFLTYGSVVDQNTGDPSTIWPY